MTVYVQSNKLSGDFTATPCKYPQRRFNPKPCRACGDDFEPLAPSHLYCGDPCKTAASTSAYLTRNYGITWKDYQEMLEDQGELCAICDGPGFRMAEHHRLLLVVDHCHETGKVRGLLCHNCNRALGLLHDNTEAMRKGIRYLEGATTIPKGSTAKRLEAHSPGDG